MEDSEDRYTTDEGKRRKNTFEEGTEVFKKSKKVIRTPDKTSKQDDKLDKIMQMLTTLTVEMQELRTEQKEYRQEIKLLKTENEEIKKENEYLNKEITRIKETLRNLERDKRRNNIIIQGMKIDTNDRNKLIPAMENFIEQHMEIQVKIKNAIKLGNKTCLAELGDTHTKELVMKNKSKLKIIKEEKIYINDDMTSEEREIQKHIRARAKEEKQNGKKIKIGFQKLIVEGRVWRWDILEKKLKEVQTDHPKN